MYTVVTLRNTIRPVYAFHSKHNNFKGVKNEIYQLWLQPYIETRWKRLYRFTKYLYNGLKFAKFFGVIKARLFAKDRIHVLQTSIHELLPPSQTILLCVLVNLSDLRNTR